MTVLLASPLWSGLLTAAVFLLGTLAGRFVNVCAARFPRHEFLRDQLRSLWRPTPHERALTAAPRWRHRIPVVGPLLAGHPLAAAGWGTRVQRSAVELTLGLLWAALFRVVVVGWDAPPPTAAFGEPVTRRPACPWDALFRFGCYAVLFASLVAASVIDLRRMLIPDGTTVPPMLLALAASVTGRLWVVPVWYEDAGALTDPFAPPAAVAVPAWTVSYPFLHGLAASVAGLVVGGGVVWFVRLVGGWVLRVEAMGFGDVVLMAMIGAFLGWQPVLLVFFLAPPLAIAGLVLALAARQGREFPFGPWLSAAAVVLVLGWDTLWPHAERLFGLGLALPILAVIIALLLAGLLWLIQIAKRLLGIEPPEWHHTGAGWTSADTLTYRASESTPLDPAPHDFRRTRWEGSASGRGTLHADRWRAGGR